MLLLLLGLFAAAGLELKHRGLGHARMGTGVHRTWSKQ